ncbi:methylated-DNA--[protein]-cysteine S-methyltransferase [Amycolatopsis sp. NPDC023774]|uniref:methylated-DNA--[protein]-cysteine S-methyltransferase n=1 Tax=Amycolatopsis sp. NPDC023774 TaxID=3155015 RepID=UPI0033F1EBBD
MSTAFWSSVDTKIGPFTAVVTGDGAVLASGWTADVAELTPLISPALAPATLTRRRDLGPVTTAVRRYHAGELDAVDDIEVRQRSGAFRQHAWDMLRKVPPGSPVSYAEYATLSGSPTAIRAAASACARNAAALFVPCHRVVRTGGAVGNFRWGTDAKRWLLTHEAAA